ncbi:MAG: DNA mismatch repair protein [Polyangiaceae bacterium]|nr:DNA mismatch repair protein [Polyangiaceae bacterium]
MARPTYLRLADRRLLRRRFGVSPTGSAFSRRPDLSPPPLPTPRAWVPVHLPDLLNLTPRLQVDAVRLACVLDFAFAGGGCADALLGAMADARPEGSSWRADSFAADLFLRDLIEASMRVSLDGWRPPIDVQFLERVLALPPDTVEGREVRRAILAELDSCPERRAALEHLYRKLCHMRGLFADADSCSRYESDQRRRDILASIRDVFDAMTPFSDAQSALRRIADIATEVASHGGYLQLVQLLDYSDNMATVDLHLRVGADGRLRELRIVRFEENARNVFHDSPFGRFVARVAMWLRGFRFGDNALVDRWVDTVFQSVLPVLPLLLQLLAHVEVYLAQLAFREACRQRGLRVCFAEFTDDGELEVDALFNPLLFAQALIPVSCDLRSAHFGLTTIITGPNSGGKTRLSQAVGLLQVLGQNGFYAPAARARLRPASGLFVSIIEEPTAAQKEGRLGTELTRIRRLFESAHTRSLIILDELCSGTNPSEGEQIFLLVLGLLKELEPQVYITTHFLELAKRLHADGHDSDVAFLKVELDAHDRPTFKFVPGVADTSLAAQTAARLGVTREELMALIRRNKRSAAGCGSS